MKRWPRSLVRTVIDRNGFGFPRHRGGPISHAGTVRRPTVRARVRAYREQFSAYWQPAALLERLVDEARAFHEPA